MTPKLVKQIIRQDFDLSASQICDRASTVISEVSLSRLLPPTLGQIAELAGPIATVQLLCCGDKTLNRGLCSEHGVSKWECKYPYYYCAREVPILSLFRGLEEVFLHLHCSIHIDTLGHRISSSSLKKLVVQLSRESLPYRIHELHPFGLCGFNYFRRQLSISPIDKRTSKTTENLIHLPYAVTGELVSRKALFPDSSLLSVESFARVVIPNLKHFEVRGSNFHHRQLLLDVFPTLTTLPGKTHKASSPSITEDPHEKLLSGIESLNLGLDHLWELRIEKFQNLRSLTLDFLHSLSDRDAKALPRSLTALSLATLQLSPSAACFLPRRLLKLTLPRIGEEQMENWIIGPTEQDETVGSQLEALNEEHAPLCLETLDAEILGFRLLYLLPKSVKTILNFHMDQWNASIYSEIQPHFPSLETLYILSPVGVEHLEILPPTIKWLAFVYNQVTTPIECLLTVLPPTLTRLTLMESQNVVPAPEERLMLPNWKVLLPETIFRVFFEGTAFLKLKMPQPTWICLYGAIEAGRLDWMLHLEHTTMLKVQIERAMLDQIWYQYLTRAVQCGSLSILKFLVHHTKSMVQSFDPIIAASGTGNVEMLDFLFQSLVNRGYTVLEVWNCIPTSEMALIMLKNDYYHSLRWLFEKSLSAEIQWKHLCEGVPEALVVPFKREPSSKLVSQALNKDSLKPFFDAVPAETPLFQSVSLQPLLRLMLNRYLGNSAQLYPKGAVAEGGEEAPFDTFLEFLGRRIDIVQCILAEADALLDAIPRTPVKLIWKLLEWLKREGKLQNLQLLSTPSGSVNFAESIARIPKPTNPDRLQEYQEFIDWLAYKEDLLPLLPLILGHSPLDHLKAEGEVIKTKGLK